MSLRLRIKENCSAFRRRGRFLTPVQVVINSETSAWSSIRLLGGSSRAERRGCCTSDSNPAPEERLMHLRAATPPLKRDCCTSGQQPRPATSKTTVSFRGRGRGLGGGAGGAGLRGRGSRGAHIPRSRVKRGPAPCDTFRHPATREGPSPARPCGLSGGTDGAGRGVDDNVCINAGHPTQQRGGVDTRSKVQQPPQGEGLLYLHTATSPKWWGLLYLSNSGVEVAARSKVQQHPLSYIPRSLDKSGD